MAMYMTGPRKELISFLRDNPDRQFSASQLQERLAGAGVSLSAIYRNLTFLEEEGLISRSMKDGSRESFYQYIDSAECRGCLHLTCTKCGKTIHMDHAAANSMLDNVSKKDGFEVSTAKTVLYGVCKDCKR